MELDELKKSHVSMNYYFSILFLLGIIISFIFVENIKWMILGIFLFLASGLWDLTFRLSVLDYELKREKP